MLVIFASALIALQAPNAATPSTSPAPQQPVKEKKICRSETGTGSIMPKTVCRTKEQWQRLTAENRADAQRLRDRRDNDRMFQGPPRDN